MYMFSVIWVFCGQSDDLEESIWVILAEEFATKINVVSNPQVDVYRNGSYLETKAALTPKLSYPGIPG